MTLMDRDEAIRAAQSMHSKNRFVPVSIMGLPAYAKGLEGNAFAIVRVTDGRPDADRSWQRLEDAGASLHAGKDLAGQDFYTALVTWDTMHESLIRDGSLVPGRAAGTEPETPARIWRISQTG